MSASAAQKRAQQTMRRFQHEVRTPLGQILGYAELVEEELEERDQLDLIPDLQRIRTAAQRLLDLVDGKLQNEKVEGAPALPEPEEDSDKASRSERDTQVDDDPDAEEGEEAGRILVVDDDPHNRDLLARRLERMGYDVQTARDGIECLRRVDAETFDLIMLDVMMPGMNGLEVLERLRSTRSMAELPVILATALAERDDAVEGLDRGANDYITKPFDFPMLLARVRTHLAASQAAREVAALARKLEFRNTFIREALGQEVPTELLIELAETPDSLEIADERRTVSVVFADIEGSRSLSKSLSPRAYVTLLRNVLAGLAAVVERYGGSVESITGDSMSAIFGIPDASDDDAARAAACALALQLEMVEINERNATSQLPAAAISVGVATGEVVIGNFGSGEDLHFKAIGEPFLVAQRIEAGGSSGEVWICDATRKRLADLAEIDRERDLDGQRLGRLLGVGGKWLMTLRAVPASGA